MALLNPSVGEMLTPEQLEQRRKIAASLAKQATAPRKITHPLQVLAQAFDGLVAGVEEGRVADSAKRLEAWNAQALSGDLSVPGAAAAAAAAPAAAAPVASSGGGVARGAALDPVASDLLPHQRAFLNAVAGPESAGRYNVRYTPSGGATFEGFDKHPAIYEKGPAGPSSAAGRYQFVKSTWDRLGGGDFSPENQDRKAWQLGQEDYKRNTGRDLDTDLRTQGFTPQIARALGSTWAGFKDNPGKAISAYASSIQRYGSQPSVAAADMPAPGARNVEMPGNGDGFVIPGPYREGQPVAEPLQAPVDRGTNLTPQEALQPLAQPAAAPMDGQTFNAITADAPLEPVFKSEGVSQPWMGTALPPQAAPAPAAPAAVAQAAPAPMPPARPANLAMPNPQADMPAPGAKPAMLQLPVSPATGMPDLSNENGAGARELMVAEALARQGQPSPFMQAAPATQPMPPAAFASAPMAAPPQAVSAAAAPPAAPASPVERVAAALPAQASPAAAPTAAPAAPASTGAQGVAAALGVNPRVLAAATSPYASEGTRKIAQTIIQKQMEDAKYNAPDAVAGRRLDLEGKGLTNEKTRRELMGEGATPLTAEERTAYGIGPNQSAYKTRNGEIKFGPAGTTINNNMDMKAEGAEASARGAGLGKRLNELADDGAKASEDAVLFQRFGDILGTVKTGKSTETLEKIRQATGLALDPNTDNVQALNALIQYIGPRLRVPGSGAQSDRELGNFLASIPSLAGTPEGNQKILETMSGIVEHRRQRSAIASEWQLGEISAKDAQKRIDSLPSPFAKREDSKPAAPAAAAPDRSALEAEARRRGLIK